MGNLFSYISCGTKLALPILLGYVTEERAQIQVFVCVLSRSYVWKSQENCQKNMHCWTQQRTLSWEFFFITNLGC